MFLNPHCISSACMCVCCVHVCATPTEFVNTHFLMSLTAWIRAGAQDRIYRGMERINKVMGVCPKADCRITPEELKDFRIQKEKEMKRFERVAARKWDAKRRQEAEIQILRYQRVAAL